MADRPQHARNNRQVRRSRLLAQAGVPLLLCCALLVVLVATADDRAPRAPAGGGGDDAARLTREAAEAARASIAELQAFAAANPDAALEVYQRARPYVGSREPEVAAAASALCEQAVARFDPGLRALLEEGGALEAQGREWEAVRRYRAFLERPGLARDVELVVRERWRTANGRLQGRHGEDLQRVRELVAQGARAEAEALVAEIERYAGPQGGAAARALLADVGSAAPAVTPDAPLDPALLARALRGRVAVGPDGAVTLTYAFDAAAELEDWWHPTQSSSGPLQPGHLEPLEPSGRPAWYVAEGVLVGDGWRRLALLVDFRPDRPVTLEVVARGERNRVAALGLQPGRCWLGGSGWLLDLPLERVPRATATITEAVQRSRRRGPALALLREAPFLELEELVVRDEPPRTKTRVRLELRPDGDAHALTLQVGDVRLEPVRVVVDDAPVRALLPALGSPVGWEEVTVTGVPAPDIAAALPALARAAADDEALSRAFHEHLRGRRPPVRLRD